jgi:hypothetical protein
MGNKKKKKLKKIIPIFLEIYSFFNSYSAFFFAVIPLLFLTTNTIEYIHCCDVIIYKKKPNPTTTTEMFFHRVKRRVGYIKKIETLEKKSEIKC